MHYLKNIPLSAAFVFLVVAIVGNARFKIGVVKTEQSKNVII